MKPRASGGTRVALAVLYLGAIFVAGTQPSSQTTRVANDKLAHAAAFCLMVLVSYPAFGLLSARWPSCQRWAAPLTAAYAVLAGAALELIQIPLPHRRGELSDFAADVIGALLGYLIVAGVGKWLKPVLS